MQRAALIKRGIQLAMRVIVEPVEQDRANFYDYIRNLNGQNGTVVQAKLTYC